MEDLAIGPRPSVDWLATLDALRARFDVVEETVSAANASYRLFRPRSCDDLISEEDFDRDERLPYWAEIWPSSRVLANELAQYVRPGARSLELGSGLGLISMTAVAAGVEATATDYYPEALEFIALNAGLNSLPPILTRHVDWRRFPDDLGRFDLVLAADVLYEGPSVPLVAEAISRTLATNGRGLVADPGRRWAAPFPAECQQRGLRCYLDRQLPSPSGPTAPRIDIYEISWAAP